jgi:hypothetical protein
MMRKVSYNCQEVYNYCGDRRFCLGHQLTIYVPKGRCTNRYSRIDNAWNGEKAHFSATRPAANSFQYSLLLIDFLMELPPGRHGTRTVPYSGTTVSLIIVGHRRARSGEQTSSPQGCHGLLRLRVAESFPQEFAQLATA